VDAGFRIVSGGRDGVMEAFSRGGRHASQWTEGSVMGILMTYDDAQANAWLDIIIPTGIGFARNTLVVASADVVVAVAGGAGTLSEIALAWQLGKPVIALAPSGGWAEKMAGQQLDGRYARHIQCADSAEDAVAQALQWIQ